ncbi:non-functional nadph-dependent codeinone reductase 2 [Quercus suber]|uniref:Non-functional nadph-dependent codeinone reductase 2 n=1 Tax=Quercus suber TaxID=58331 RepID=A0AAW0IXS8_QUESU
MGNIPEIPVDSTGKTIPVIGFGTAEYPFGASFETLRDSLLHAIKLGYRHFDSAALYQSEQPLGEAIDAALGLGLIKSRDDLFITSKLWCSDAHHDCVLPAIQKTLNVKPGEYELPVKKKDLLPIDIKSVWEAMEECQKLGLAKSIGVEMNPLWQQKKLRESCKNKGIRITAYSPLGAKGTLWGTNWVMECEVLKQIAEATGKTIAQICIRWVYEQGVSVLVKSFNKDRMKENLDIFDWKLSPEDLEKISQIPQRKGFPGLEFISEEGPYKSLSELWDGEI